jgi:hypothetical protein
MACKSKKMVVVKMPGPTGNFHGLCLQFLEFEINTCLLAQAILSILAACPMALGLVH